MNALRPIIGGIALSGVFFAPVWVPLILSGALALRYRAWEAVATGFLIDVLYAPAGFFVGIPMPATVAMLAVVFGLSLWRRQLAV